MGIKYGVPELSLTLPLYNEEICAQDIILDLIKTFDEAKINYELVLVDNASTDRTPKIVEDFAKKYPKIYAIHLQKNLRFGGGVTTGLKNCRGKYLGFTAGDGQVTAVDTLRIYNFLKSSGFDICKATRIDRKERLIRNILSIVYNFLVFLLFFRAIPDVNGYPMIMKRVAYEKINPSSKNWMINIEILQKANKNKLKVASIPVKYSRRKSGRSHVNSSTLLEFIIQLLSFRFANLR